MRRSRLPTYCRLLERYYQMIFHETWWDGRRETLVSEMDGVWGKLSLEEQEVAKTFATGLYEKRICPVVQ